MQKTLLVAAALTLPLPAFAQHAAPTPAAPATRAVQQGYEQGFRDCAPDLDQAVRLVHEDDAAYSHLGTWSKEDPNRELFNSVTAGPATGVTSFTGVKAASGKCDTVITQVVPVPNQSCAQVQKTAFRDWKYFNDLGGVAIYEDPTSTSVSVLLAPTAKKSCLIIKQAVFYGG